MVFVDDCRWITFHQLAPLLRRAGVRTIRVSTRTRRRTHITSWLLYDRYVELEDATDTETLREILTSEDVMDIQFVETLGQLVRQNIDLLRPEVAKQVERRLAVMDKVKAAQLFNEAGLRTPAVIPFAEASPQQVADTFGLPVVVKARVGSGGEHVYIAHDLDALEAVASDWGTEPERHFYEQYVAGEKLNYAASVSATGIEQELSYRVTGWVGPVGISSEVQTVRDPQLAAFGRQAVKTVDCTGLINMDVIRDDQGVDWLIDFNARTFGGAANFLPVGLDTSEGYLRAIGLRAEPPTRRSPPSDVLIRVFPASLSDAINTEGVGRATLAFLRESLPYVKLLGFRYWLSEALANGDAIRRASRSRREHRRTSPGRVAN